MKTLKLKFPEWRGGDNPHYYIGGQLLSWLMPENKGQKQIEVPVFTNFSDEKRMTDGILWKNELLKQQMAAIEILEAERPDKIITMGGDCSIEQAPIDYLHGRYSENTALIWIDAHPDISQPDDFSHEHAMVLGNLIGAGAREFAELVKHPFNRKDIMYAGLVADQLETWERKFLKDCPISYATPEELKNDSDKIIHWIQNGGYQHIIIHWDLDVLSPKYFSSLLCNEPGISSVEYAVGRMKLEQVIRLIEDISDTADVVGLGITEFMPWDVIRLREMLGKLSVFQ